MPVKSFLHLARLAKRRASGALLTLRSRGHPREGNTGAMPVVFMPRFHSNRT